MEENTLAFRPPIGNTIDVQESSFPFVGDLFVLSSEKSFSPKYGLYPTTSVKWPLFASIALFGTLKII